MGTVICDNMMTVKKENFPFQLSIEERVKDIIRFWMPNWEVQEFGNGWAHYLVQGMQKKETENEK